MSRVSYRLRFPGQVFDGQAGLHQNMARDYDPAVGRYVENDPIGLNGGINTYAYVNDAPTMEYDIKGREAYGFLLGPTPPPVRMPVVRPEVRSWICNVVLSNDNVNWDIKRAASAAYGVRHANDDPIVREGENWLTAAAFTGWLDPQAYAINIYIWQWFKWLPIGDEP